MRFWTINWQGVTPTTLTRTEDGIRQWIAFDSQKTARKAMAETNDNMTTPVPATLVSFTLKDAAESNVSAVGLVYLK